MFQTYQVFDNLQRHKAELHASARLNNGLGLARWTNDDDFIAQDNADPYPEPLSG